MQASGGATPLMYACQQCRENEVVEIMRKQPHSVKDRDRTFKTPLHYCAENPNSSCAEAVLKVAPELVNAQDENGYCTLHLAVIAGNKSLIKLLIAKGADVNIHDNEGHSAVHWAIVSSEKEALEMIIRAGANPSTPDIHGGYPLHYAVQMCGCSCDYVRNFEDTVRVVETLLNFGVDVGVKDKDGREPILWAASAGSADAVVHLVSGGACVEAADKDGLTALHCAASRGHTTTLETLISLCGANVDVIDGNGCSALFYSVTLGHADATELLLQLGAEPNRQDRKGRTPAHCGAAKGQLETLRILQKHGGNLWMRNVKGDIPLHEAVASGRKDLVLWLLSQCSEAINIANNDGRCPLHIASMYNNTEMVKVLLDCKSLVNPVMRTSKGVLMTPLNVALSKGHRSCGKYLQLHGGVPFSKVSKVEAASGFALRVSPSRDDAMLSPGEKSGETPSRAKIPKSRSSTDFQENRENVKMEMIEKKKVYRRRKKKKNPSNALTQESDSDDSGHDLKVKTPNNRRGEKSNEDDEGNGEDERTRASKVQPDGKKSDKSQADSDVVPKNGSNGQVRASEEPAVVTKLTKSRAETKPLQRNKSFNETKNVSDLSPEDFPPLMQTVSQLDIVIMEPDIEVAKSENENNEANRRNAAGGDPSADNATATEAREKEESSEIVIVVKTTSGDGTSGESNVQVEESDLKVDEKTEEEGSSSQEKTGKASGAKKPNGGSGEDETGSKSSGGKSSEERSIRKSVKSPKSSDGESVRKDSKTGKKANSGSEGSDRHRKTPSPKDKGEEKSSDETVGKDGEIERSASLETKTNDDTKQEEKKEGEAETGGTGTEILSTNGPETKVEVVSEEVTKSENFLAEGTPEAEEQVKNADNATEPVIEAEEESNVLPPESAAPSPEKEEMEETSEMQSPVEEATTEKEAPAVVTTDGADEKPPEGNDAIEVETAEKSVEDLAPTENVAEPEEKVEEPLEVQLSESTSTSEKNLADDSESQVEIKSTVAEEPEKENLNHSVEKPSAEFHQTESGQSEEVKEAAVEHINHEDEQKEGEKEEKAEVDVEAEEVGVEEGEGEEEKEEAIISPKEADQNEEIQKDVQKDEVTTVEGDEETQEGSSQMKTGFSDDKYYKTPRVSRLCRRNRDVKDDLNQISVTQLVQNTIRKYHMERGIFYQLLELKRYQIRSGRANEQVLVKRLADEYEKSRVFLGMKPFSGLYKFREFEKFLYDQLKALNSRRGFIIPEVKSHDDIDALSGLLKKSRYKILSETPPPETVCTCITQRCHHSACAYTNVPCSAYITDLRRHGRQKPRRESFFPRIDRSPAPRPDARRQKERPATLELMQGSEKHVITLPENSPSAGRRYYVTFTIKGAPAFEEDDFAADPKDCFKHRHAKSV